MTLDIRILAGGLLAFLALSNASMAQHPTTPAPVNGADRGVYVQAAFPLDEPRHHCLDVPGHGDRVDVAKDLTVHTCKEGLWNLDERFERASIVTNELKMPQYGLCVAAREARAGAALGLVDCGSTPLAKWRYAEARLMLRDNPGLCITIGPEASQLTPGGRRMPSRNMARSVGLEPCSDAAIERQLWRFADPLPVSKPLLPPASQ